MKISTLLLHLLVLLPTLPVTANDATAPDPLHQLAQSQTPLLIQSGPNQLLMGVTDDNFAIYQEGQKLYATALLPNARRREIADIAPNNVAQILQVGNVVMVWTNQDLTSPGGGVSPLVIWSAATGPRRLSEKSAVGLIATDASPSNLQVMFLTNATPLQGDLAIVDVLGLFKPRILLKQIQLDFPFGQCRPLAAFVGPPGRAVPTAEYCDGAATTATLSRWVGGKRIDLIDNIATPLPFTLETNPQQTAFFVRLAGSGHPVVVTDQGKVSIVDRVGGTGGFVTAQGTAAYAARATSSAPAELRLARRGAGPITVAAQFAFAHTSAFNNLSGYSKRQTPSPDGTQVLFSGSIDPATGLADIQLLNLQTGAVTVVDGRQRNLSGFDVFTTDSNFAMYNSGFNSATSTGALAVADRAGLARQISDDGTVFFNRATTASNVAFNDRLRFNSAPFGTFGLSRGDVRVADASQPNTRARLVASQANFVFLPSHRGRGLVFTTDSDATPGLYLANSEP